MLPGELNAEEVSSLFVCSLHFEPEDIVHNRERTTLRRTAVPSRTRCEGKTHVLHCVSLIPTPYLQGPVLFGGPRWQPCQATNSPNWLPMGTGHPIF